MSIFGKKEEQGHTAASWEVAQSDLGAKEAVLEEERILKQQARELVEQVRAKNPKLADAMKFNLGTLKLTPLGYNSAEWTAKQARGTLEALKNTGNIEADALNTEYNRLLQMVYDFEKGKLGMHQEAGPESGENPDVAA